MCVLRSPGTRRGVTEGPAPRPARRPSAARSLRLLQTIDDVAQVRGDVPYFVGRIRAIKDHASRFVDDPDSPLRTHVSVPTTRRVAALGNLKCRAFAHRSGSLRRARAISLCSSMTLEACLSGSRLNAPSPLLIRTSASYISGALAIRRALASRSALYS